MISIAEHLSSRELSWDSAAEKAGLSAERLRQVADGADASLGEMRGIAKALRIPLSAIVDESPADPIRLLFRQTVDQRAAGVASSVEVLSAQIRDALDVATGYPRTRAGWTCSEASKPKSSTRSNSPTCFAKRMEGLTTRSPFRS